MRRRKRKNKSKRKSENVRGTANRNDDAGYRDDGRKVVNHLNNKKFGSTVPFVVSFDRKVTIKIPEIYSVSENPESVVAFLRKLYTILINKRIEEVYFDYSECVEFGLSASLMMDVIVMAVDGYRESVGKPIYLSGNYPKDKYIKDIFLASGLPRHIQAESREKPDESKMECFEMVSGRHGKGTKKAAKVSTDLTTYFNRCLKTQKFTLNAQGIQMMSDMLGEVIDNCEIHGGSNTTWYVQGHYQMRERNIGEMQIVFLTLGDTIHEGLKNDTSEETRHRLDYMMQRQQENLTDQWNEESIYTLLSLQEGISRLRTKDNKGYKFRGTGTVTMIERFFTIGGTDGGQSPKMTIVSGHTVIKFDGKYKMKDEQFADDPVFGNTKLKIIAFNQDNDIYQPADRHNVYNMKEFFPGTVISLKFYLDREYIESKKKGVRTDGSKG